MKYIPLKDLEVYKLSRELSKIGWEIYQELDWRDKKIMGDQFIDSTDSCGANIAEGYGRFHYMDQIKFYYNARGSLYECNGHWIELLRERRRVDLSKYQKFKSTANRLLPKLNRFIGSRYRANKKN